MHEGETVVSVAQARALVAAQVLQWAGLALRPLGVAGSDNVMRLGEDLVLFRDLSGRPGVLGAKCAHRRANLCLGNVSKSGLRCRYHGWLYNHEGRVLEMPGEPAGST